MRLYSTSSLRLNESMGLDKDGGVDLSKNQTISLHRTASGEIKEILAGIEGISFQENPLDVFIILARYKFAARLLRKDQRVVDVGCGLGSGSLFLRQFAGHVTGADYDQGVIESNKKRFAHLDRLDFSVLDLLNPHKHLNTYDAVVSMDVIEHFHKEKMDQIAAAYAGLVKPGGFAVIGTPNKASQPYASKNRLESHLHEFEPEEYRQLLSKHFSNVFCLV